MYEETKLELGSFLVFVEQMAFNLIFYGMFFSSKPAFSSYFLNQLITFDLN